MRNFTRIASLLLLLCTAFPGLSQDSKELEPGYYIVVGAYAPSRENVAQNYTEVLTRRGIKAGYGFNSIRNYYFVYLRYFPTLQESLKDMQKTRKESEFADAWVRVVTGDIASSRLKHESEQPVVTEKQTEQVNAQKTDSGVAAPLKPKEEVIVKPVVEEPKKEMVAEKTESKREAIVSNDAVAVTENPEIIQYDKMTLGNTEVFLSLYNQNNNRIVEGDVKVVDTDRTKLIKEVKGNEYLLLPDPKSKSGQLTLICEAFGYRKIQQEINYPFPLADTVKDYVDLMGTTVVINFDLMRYRLGDVATLYHVYFYNDAALMLPESKFELNSLLQMMQENPKYRIRLHGHSNGNYNGKIISLGPDKNFFSLEGSVNSIGSSKDLSRQRAETIKEFLLSNGIDAARVEIKSWGGKKPIYDKHSVNAKRNVRVEVEILGA
jgi:outer membrane protein OmpA-like peptidoglycan-associated protein